ncbi:MAG: hypothetical protein AAFQ82_05920, partial [Myxococcota bacterium]
GLIAFTDGTDFTTTARLVDPAGNAAEVASVPFEVRLAAPRATFDIPEAPGLLTSANDVSSDAGFQGQFRVEYSGFSSGSTVRLCSTVAPPGGGLGDCALGTAETGPDVGGGSPSETGLRGVIVATGLTSGSFEAGATFFPERSLSEGEQWLHFEVEEADLDPQVASRFFRFVVDTVGPTVTAFTLDQNVTDNDPVDQVALAAAEGTVDSGRLLTNASVSVTGAEEGATVEVLSNLGGSNNVVGQGVLTGGSVTFTLSVGSGLQVLTVNVLDSAGNSNAVAGNPEAITALVDFTPPTAGVPEPALSVYTSLNGTVDPGATPDAADDRLILGSAVALSIQVADDLDLENGSLTLTAFAEAGRTTQLEELSLPLGAGASTVSAAAFPFVSGANFLRATITDAVGNTASIDTTNAYVADFRGPGLALEVRDDMGVALTGCDAFPGCTVATAAPPVMGDPRTWLDTALNDLFYEVSECVTFADPAVESCPVSARLESRIVTMDSPGGPTDPRAFSAVTGGAVSVNDTAFSSFSALASGELFDPGDVREVRLVATDENGNQSVSNSLFLDLNIDGVIVTVERLAAGVPSGDILENDVFFGIAENEDLTGASFLIDFRVTVSAVSGELPDQVVLTATSIDGSNMGAMTMDVSGAGTSTYVVDVLDVVLATSAGGNDKPNTITVEVSCGVAGACGERSYETIIADIDAPTYQFDRCSLCDFNVPFVGDEAALCGTCPVTNVEEFTGLDANSDANIEDELVERAQWDIELDADGNPVNGFSTSGVRPLRVKLNGVEQSPLVELTSSQASLSGGQVLATDCPGATCRAVFANLSAPTLANGLFHDVSVSFEDRAGNPAVPDPNRIDEETETIYADTDTTRPGSPVLTVCIGESTTPTAITNPATDPATFEAASCDASCTATGACSRRDGEVTISFVAPADDESAGDRVSTYEVHAFALETDYGGSTYSNCGEELSVDGPFETTVVATPSVDPGEIETVTVTGLNLPRSYCFVVEAVDDLGNASVLTSFASERVLPWITEVPSQSVAEIAAFDPADPDIAVTEAFAFVDPAVDGDLGQRIQNVGDIDGDGLDDLVASAFDGAGSPKIAIFYSSTGDLSAPVIINGPSSSLFGWRIRGGNIDGTAPNDLMITAPTTDTSDGSGSGGASGGAVYIWWGANGGIRTDSASDSRLPSIRPDVTILGEAGEFIGFDAQVADVDANDSDDVVFVSRSTFGFSGGDRARFPGAPALFYLDTSAVYTGSPAPLARPDFIIDPTSVSSGGFLELEAGDYNGDGSGKAELVVIDRFVDGTNAASGEAYVFEGGATTGGPISGVIRPVIAP